MISLINYMFCVLFILIEGLVSLISALISTIRRIISLISGRILTTCGIISLIFGLISLQVSALQLNTLCSACTALERRYCLQKMHFLRPTLVCNTCLGEHFDQVLGKSTWWLWNNLCITFYSKNIPKYLRLWPYCISFCQFKRGLCTHKIQYGLSPNAFVNCHCKK